MLIEPGSARKIRRRESSLELYKILFSLFNKRPEDAQDDQSWQTAGTDKVAAKRFGAGVWSKTFSTLYEIHRIQSGSSSVCKCFKSTLLIWLVLVD